MKVFFFWYVFIMLLPGTVMTQREKTLSIISYNIQMLPCILNKNQKDRLALIAPKMQSYDIVVFSEVFDRGMKKRLIKSMKPVFTFHTKVAGQCDLDCSYADNRICQTGGVKLFACCRPHLTTEAQEVWH